MKAKVIENMNLADVLDFTVTAIKNSLNRILFFIMLFILPIIVSIILILINEHDVILVTLLYLFVSIYLGLVFVILELIITETVYQKEILDSDARINDILKKSFRKFGWGLLNFIVYNVFLTMVIFLIMIFALLIIGIFVSSISMVSGFENISIINEGTFIFLVFIAYYIVCFILINISTFKFKFYAYFIMAENDKGFNPIARSFQVTGKDFVVIIFSQLLCFLLVLGIYVFFSIGLAIIYEFGIDIPYYEEIINDKLVFFYLSIVLVILYPFFVVLNTITCLYLKVKNEGFDLVIKTRHFINENYKKVIGVGK